MWKRGILALHLLAGLALAGCAGGHYYAYGPPPPPRVEYVGVAPGPGYAWVDGYWDRRNRWYWAPGRWAAPPRPYAVWVRGHYVRRHGGYLYVPGHWR